MLRLLGLALGAGVAMAIVAHVHADSPPTFVWPWAGSEGWRYTQSFHVDHALDFQPQIAANCDDPVDTTHTVRPAAPGTVVEVGVRGAPQPPLPVSLVIDHGGGWSSYYTHLANVPSTIEVGSAVGYGTNLGNPSCYGGCTSESGLCANGRHLHFQLRRDGSGSGILAATVCGWTVGADGGISRDGETYYEDLSGPAPIANTGCPTGKDTEPPPFVAGDVSCDGDTSSIDALMVLQADAGLLASLPCPHNADANGDGVVNAVDALAILQHAAGLLVL